jgi:hypothetical protein
MPQTHAGERVDTEQAQRSEQWYHPDLPVLMM